MLGFENEKLKKIETIIDQKLKCLEIRKESEKSNNFEIIVIPATTNSNEIQNNIVYENKDIQYIYFFNEINKQTKTNDSQRKLR